MNKKILVIVTILAISLMLTPLTLAKPGAEKNNEDTFLTLYVFFSSTVSYGGGKFNPQYVGARTSTIIWLETADVCDITIDGTKTYSLTTDFDYEGTITMFMNNADDQTFANVKIEYSYIFKSASGIDGTLNMRAVGKTWWDIDGQHYDVTIRGQGTDQLEGVKLMGMGMEGVGGIVHEGTVTNWPMPTP